MLFSLIFLFFLRGSPADIALAIAGGGAAEEHGPLDMGRSQAWLAVAAGKEELRKQGGGCFLFCLFCVVCLLFCCFACFVDFVLLLFVVCCCLNLLLFVVFFFWFLVVLFELVFKCFYFESFLKISS